jgi:hypothetical protein
VLEVKEDAILDSYEQKYMFERRIFQIKKKGLGFRIKTITEDLERFIPYDEITKNTKIEKAKNILYVLFLLFVSVLAIGYLIEVKGFELSASYFFNIIFVISFVTVFLFIYLKEGVRYKRLKCDNSTVAFFYNKSNKRDVDKFIAKVLEARNNYFRSKYLQKDESISLALYLNRIRWLMEEEIIDSQEYEFIKAQFFKQP